MMTISAFPSWPFLTRTAKQKFTLLHPTSKAKEKWPGDEVGSSEQLIEVKCFFKLSADHWLVIIGGRLRSIIKMPYNK